MDTGVIVIIALIAIAIIVLTSKPFRVWAKGRNRTDEQKRVIKYLIFGPDRSKISTDEFDTICYNMYSNSLLLDKAIKKLGINKDDLVKHRHEKVDSTYLVVRNYIKDESSAMVRMLSLEDFRSSRMDCLMVLFGERKLYFYQLSYHTDKIEEEESSYEYDYYEIRQFMVTAESKKEEAVMASFAIQKNAPEDDKKIDPNSLIQKFPSMIMNKKSFDSWSIVATHLDYPKLRNAYKDKAEDEKKALRYFLANDFLPLPLTDSEYERMIDKALPSEQLKAQGMNNMDIREKDIRFAEPITFRSYIYGSNNLEIKGRDGAWRSSIPQLTWLFFGEHQIYVHTVTYNMTNSVKQEATQEIFYNDITSIRTEERSLERKADNVTVVLSYYQLTIMFSGDNLTLTLPILSDDNDRKIHAMRNLLRQKKQTKSKELSDYSDLV